MLTTEFLEHLVARDVESERADGRACLVHDRWTRRERQCTEIAQALGVLLMKDRGAEQAGLSGKPGPGEISKSFRVR